MVPKHPAPYPNGTKASSPYPNGIKGFFMEVKKEPEL
jgi:hypothetical protein